MKKLFVVLLVMIFPFLADAQNENLKQVKLKSGVTISGYVSEAADGSVTITTKDGDQFWYQAFELDTISEDPSVIESRRRAEAKANEEKKQRRAQEKAEAKELKKAKRAAIKMKERGFQINVEAGVAGMNFSDVVFSPLIVRIIPGYRINKYFFVGGCLGVSPIYYPGSVSTYAMTGDLTFRYNVLAKRVTPYVGIRAGGGLSLAGWYYDEDARDFGYYYNGMEDEMPSIVSVFGADLGLMLRTRRGGGFNIGVNLMFSPSPDEWFSHMFLPVVTIGWTF